MTAEAATLIAAVLAFLAALASAIFAFWNGVRSRRRDALSEIAAHRVRWMEDLRLRIAEFEAAVTSYNFSRNRTMDALTEILLLRSQIVMVTNYSEHIELNKIIERLTLSCVTLRQSDPSAEATSSDDSVLDDELDRAMEERGLLKEGEFGGAIGEMQAAAKILLKTEWEKVKREIRGARS